MVVVVLVVVELVVVVLVVVVVVVGGVTSTLPSGRMCVCIVRTFLKSHRLFGISVMCDPSRKCDPSVIHVIF